MKNRKFIISVIAVLIINAAALGFWIYFISKISSKRILIKNFREEIKISEERIQNARSLAILLKNVKSGGEKFSAVFLNSNHFVELVEKLEFIGKKTGVELTIKSVKLPDSSNAEPRIDLQIKGAFRDIFHYLSLFENIPYKIGVEKFNLAKRESDKKITWQADMEIKILSYQNI